MRVLSSHILGRMEKSDVDEVILMCQSVPVDILLDHIAGFLFRGLAAAQQRKGMSIYECCESINVSYDEADAVLRCLWPSICP